ncbi:hypothetical protein [Zobellella maritima]|uniref:hypothetical protein n=1 Tax=Zobellella maritima TaxID=2059725 RepID=UPI000E3026B6|nr:hypothetical protein [Zobellella maritima]
MKQLIIAAFMLLISACSSLQTPGETNIAVSSLLDEIQIAINEIDKRTAGSSLPPFRSAEIQLSTTAGRKADGSAALVLAGGAGKATTHANTLTLELIPAADSVRIPGRSTGHDIADYVIAAVTAIDGKRFLKLHTLNVEAGLEVRRTLEGGIDVELAGMSLEGKHSVEASTGHRLKLTFAHAAYMEQQPL